MYMMSSYDFIVSERAKLELGCKNKGKIDKLSIRVR